MGYTTDFWGEVTVSPPLDTSEIDFLNRFAGSRRMNRKKGPYFAEPGGNYGQDRTDDIINYNDPPPGQPGLWCQWIPSDDGKTIGWDGGEKFYNSVEWMQYIIDHFLRPGAIAKAELPFLQANHVVSGIIDAQGEEPDDRWRLVVTNNKVTQQYASISFGE